MLGSLPMASGNSSPGVSEWAGPEKEKQCLDHNNVQGKSEDGGLSTKSRDRVFLCGEARTCSWSPSSLSFFT